MTKRRHGTGEKYKEVILPVPQVMYDRIKEGLENGVKQALVPSDMTVREFMLVVLANGTALIEANLKAKEREGSLVLTPEEAQAGQKSAMAAAEAKARWERQLGRQQSI